MFLIERSNIQCPSLGKSTSYRRLYKLELMHAALLSSLILPNYLAHTTYTVSCNSCYMYLFSQNIGLRGVLDLLGIRCTIGSHDILPPSKETLLESFTRPHNPAARISVGGRALAKHCHRDDSLQWWGKCTGSELVDPLYYYTVAAVVLVVVIYTGVPKYLESCI